MKNLILSVLLAVSSTCLGANDVPPSAFLKCYKAIDQRSYGPKVYSPKNDVAIIPNGHGGVYAYSGDDIYLSENIKKVPSSYYLWNVGDKDINFVFDQNPPSDYWDRLDNLRAKKHLTYGKNTAMKSLFKIEDSPPADKSETIKTTSKASWTSGRALDGGAFHPSLQILQDDLTNRISSMPGYFSDYKIPPSEVVSSLSACEKTGDPRVLEAIKGVYKKMGVENSVGTAPSTNGQRVTK